MCKCNALFILTFLFLHLALVLTLEIHVILEDTIQLDSDTAQAVGIDLPSDIDWPGGELNELLQNCKKGTCKFCFKKGIKGKTTVSLGRKIMCLSGNIK